MQPADLNNPYITKKRDGLQCLGMNCLELVSKSKRRLWILMTTVKLQNMNSDDNYTTTSQITRKKLASAMRSPELSSAAFRVLLLRVLDILAWRRSVKLETYIVMEPPKLEYIAGWERIFAEHNVPIAWLDENDCAVIPRYSQSIISKRVSDSTQGIVKGLMEEIGMLNEGEEIRINLGSPTMVRVDPPSNVEADSWWAKKKVVKMRKSKIVLEWQVRLRNYSKKRYGTTGMFQLICPKELNKTHVIVRRRTEEERQSTQMCGFRPNKGKEKEIFV